MSEFSGNVLGTSENPVVSASRGRFFVANEEHGGGRSKKKSLISWIVTGVLLAAAVCFIVAISIDTTKLPEFDRLKKLIGQPVATAQLPAQEVEYAGVPLTLRLLSDGEVVSGFCYSRVTDMEQGVNDLFFMGASLLERYGETSDFDVSSLLGITKNELLEELNGQLPYSARWTWDLTERETVNISALTERADWPGKVAGYLIDPGRFYLDFSVSGDPAAGTALVEMAFKVEVGREPKDDMDGESASAEELNALFENSLKTDGAYTEMLAGSLTKAFNADPRLFLRTLAAQDAQIRQQVAVLLVHHQRLQPNGRYAGFQAELQQLSRSEDTAISEQAGSILQQVESIEAQFAAGN